MSSNVTNAYAEMARGGVSFRASALWPGVLSDRKVPHVGAVFAVDFVKSVAACVRRGAAEGGFSPCETVRVSEVYAVSVMVSVFGTNRSIFPSGLASGGKASK